MRMTEMEICREYNAAKDRRAQIGILADLNVCEKEDILRILILNGQDVTVAGPKKPGQKGDKVLQMMFSLLDEADEKVKEAEMEYKKIVQCMKQYGKEKSSV